MFGLKKKTRNEERIDELLESLEKHPDNANYRLRLADLYLRAGKKKSALSEYQKAAEYLRSEGLNVKAISVYKKKFSLNGMSLDDYKSLASLYYEEGLVAEAKKTYEKILQIESHDSEAQAGLQSLENQMPPPSIVTATQLSQRDQPPPVDDDEAVPIETLVAPTQPAESSSTLPLEAPPGNEPDQPGSDDLFKPLEAPEGRSAPNAREDSTTGESDLQIDDLLRTVESLAEGKPDSMDPGQDEKPQDVGLHGISDQREASTESVFPEEKDGGVLKAEADPSREDPDLHYNLGVAYREMELIDKAMEEFTEALQEGNNRLDCLIMLARCNFEKGLFKEATAFIHRALKLEDLTQHQIDLLHRQLQDMEAVGELG